jgi:hypothetical protein
MCCLIYSSCEIYDEMMGVVSIGRFETRDLLSHRANSALVILLLSSVRLRTSISFRDAGQFQVDSLLLVRTWYCKPTIQWQTGPVSRGSKSKH